MYIAFAWLDSRGLGYSKDKYLTMKHLNDFLIGIERVLLEVGSMGAQIVFNEHSLSTNLLLQNRCIVGGI